MAVAAEIWAALLGGGFGVVTAAVAVYLDRRAQRRAEARMLLTAAAEKLHELSEAAYEFYATAPDRRPTDLDERLRAAVRQVQRRSGARGRARQAGIEVELNHLLTGWTAMGDRDERHDLGPEGDMGDRLVLSGLFDRVWAAAVGRETPQRRHTVMDSALALRWLEHGLAYEDLPPVDTSRRGLLRQWRQRRQLLRVERRQPMESGRQLARAVRRGHEPPPSPLAALGRRLGESDDTRR